MDIISYFESTFGVLSITVYFIMWSWRLQEILSLKSGQNRFRTYFWAMIFSDANEGTWFLQVYLTEFYLYFHRKQKYVCDHIGTTFYRHLKMHFWNFWKKIQKMPKFQRPIFAERVTFTDFFFAKLIFSSKGTKYVKIRKFWVGQYGNMPKLPDSYRHWLLNVIFTEINFQGKILSERLNNILINL